MVKEPQRSSEVVVDGDGPSNSNLKSSETSKISFNDRKRNFKSAHRNQGGLKKISSNIVKLKKTNLQSPNVLQVLKKKRKRPMKDTVEKSGRHSPRQKFAVFKPPAGSQSTATMHPTQKDAEIKDCQPGDSQPVLKIQVERLAPENGHNGKTEQQPEQQPEQQSEQQSEQSEPVVQIENEATVENNGHNHHDIIDHEEEIVDVGAISEAEVAPVIPEEEEAPVHEDIGNGVPEEPLLLSSRLRGSAKKGPSSSRSSSPADSLHKERPSRKLNYVHPVVEVSVEENLEVSGLADFDEPLVVKGGAEDLEVSAAVPVEVEKTSVKPRTPAKASSPSRLKKAPKSPTTPVEEVTARRGRKPKSDEKKHPLEDSYPQASMSMMEDLVQYKAVTGSAGSVIRSVRARRPIRRSRNISALDSSLHNLSSWESESKVLSPRGGGVSLIDTSLINGDESPLSVSVAHKRKISDDDLDCKELKKAKNESSLTSSFFSIVTSPISALKEKFRGGALSSSTPFYGERKAAVDTDASMMSAEENGAEENAAEENGAEENGAEENGAEEKGAEENGAEERVEEPQIACLPVATPEVPPKNWCSLM